MATLKYKDENGNYQPIVGINMQNEVVQTTGQSTTAVMSQKAVSDLIPAQASSSNQLADKEFVNSSITTATATYQGSYNLVSDLSLTISASHGQIETALNTAALGADKNDYCFVQIPTADATPTEIASVERYKHNGTTWSYEYAINNSGFTAAQWAAVNSNITSGLVAKLNGMIGTSTTNDIVSLFGMNSGGDCKNVGLSDLASLLGEDNYILINNINYAPLEIRRKNSWSSGIKFSNIVDGILGSICISGSSNTPPYVLSFLDHNDNEYQIIHTGILNAKTLIRAVTDNANPWKGSNDMMGLLVEYKNSSDIYKFELAMRGNNTSAGNVTPNFALRYLNCSVSNPHNTWSNWKML